MSQPLYQSQYWGWPADQLAPGTAAEPIRRDVESRHLARQFTDPETLREFRGLLDSWRNVDWWVTLKREYGLRWDVEGVLMEWSAIAERLSPGRELPELAHLRAALGRLLEEGY